MTSDHRAPVVIVGAGPVGMTTALLLAELGVGSVLLERHAQPYPLPRAVHVDEEVVRILQRVGVAEDFARISRPMPGLRLVDRHLHTLAEFRRDAPLGAHGHPQANMFDQPELESLLGQAVTNRGGIEVRRGVELVGLRAERPGDDSPVLLEVDDLTTGTRETLCAPAVLGCDGANSLVRRLIGAANVDLGKPDRWFVVDVRCDTILPAAGDPWDGVQQVCDPRRAATFMRIGPARYRWEFRLHDSENADDLARPDVLLELLAPWFGPAPVPDVEVVRSSEYVFRARVADRWQRGRAFLLGDAAHLTPPFIGQGLGLGLRDAANLSWKLAAVLRDGADERLLETYTAERLPHARRLIGMARLMGWAMTGGQDRADVLRRATLATLGHFPSATPRLADTTVPALRAGALVGSRSPVATMRGRRHLAGTFLPQPWVTVGGTRRRLDDVLGPSFAVLTDGSTDPELVGLAHRLGARLVTVRGPGGATGGDGPSTADCVDDSGVLRDWLAAAGTSAVLVRPDRVVAAVAARGSAPGARLASAARSLTDLVRPR